MGEGSKRREIVSTLIGPGDPKWQWFLTGTPHDVYHLPAYASVASKYEGGTAVAFYAETGQSSFLLPLLIRTLPEYLEAPKCWQDAASPYGYPGPLSCNLDDPETFRSFLRAFQSCALENDIVTAFIRFHPLLNNAPQGFSEMGELIRHGETVYVDLGKPSNEIWRDLKHGHRENIRKLHRLGFTVEFDSWSRMDGFIAAYRATMERVGAEDFYRFPEGYFYDLREALENRLHLCTVQAPNGELASASLFTLENGIAQDHLAATNDQYVRFGPSKLMTYSQAIWLKAAGGTLFHLGGGVSSHDDSLFYFKAGFSKLRARFWTCSAILDQAKYTRLLKAAEGRVEARQGYFFPPYR